MACNSWGSSAPVYSTSRLPTGGSPWPRAMKSLTSRACRKSWSSIDERSSASLLNGTGVCTIAAILWARSGFATMAARAGRRIRLRRSIGSGAARAVPGVLPGTALAAPEPIDLLNRIRLPARAAMVANPDRAHKIAAIVQTPVPFSSDAELLSSIEDQLFRHAREVNDIIARGHGEPPVGNRDVEYTGALDPQLLQAINSSVPRFDAGRYAAHYASLYYEPDGQLAVPVLTLFTVRDPALPAVMNELVYQERVSTAGRSDFLRRQQSSVGYGHCTSRLADRVAAFNNLVNWVEP